MSIQRLVTSAQAAQFEHLALRDRRAAIGLVDAASHAADRTSRPARRDESMVDLCGLIARTMRGQAATRLLDSWRRGGLPERAQIVALQAWLWRPAGITMGRKDQYGALLVPVRVRWDGQPDGALIVRDADATDGEVSLNWSTDALGVNDAGTAVLRRTTWAGFTGAGSLEQDADGGTEIPRAIDAPVLDRDEQHRVLCGWIEDGIEARWQFLSLLDDALDKALHRAHMALVAEYSEQIYGDPNASSRPVLHEESLEALRSRLVYGDEDDFSDAAREGSLMMRLITDTHDVGVFDNVDPQRWLRVKIGQLARYWVRREVGDPEAGPKIRRTARELGIDDPEKVAAALNGIGTRRVAAALGLAPHPDAGALRFGFGEDTDYDAWIEKAARSV